jgi:lon-related putative ATP-dependent protease
LSFETTAEIEPLKDLSQGIGQPRAVEALKFGVGIQQQGYNIYALGPPGTGKHTIVRQFVSHHLEDSASPSDWCYVNNFEDWGKPKALNLPKGRGNELSHDMQQFVEELPNTLKAAFESEEYQNRLQSTEQEYKDQQQKVFEDLQKKAEEKSLTLVRTPSGFAFAPVKDNEVVSPDDFQKLPEDERQQFEQDIQEMQKESQRVFQKFPAWQRELRQKVRSLNQEVASYAVDPLINEIREKFNDVQAVSDFLDAVKKDIVDNVQTILAGEGQQQGSDQQSSSAMGGGGQGMEGGRYLRKYKVNVAVDNSQTEGAPVVYEDNPTYANLVGRVEHQPMMGALVTDFNLIKPGALHKANGGALILDAHKVLMQPGAWDGLKRALNSREIKIESLAEMFSLISTITLQPEPIPLDVKVVLVGSPLIYYLLNHLDPEFAKLFKVAADFDTQMDWSDEHLHAFARLLASMIEHDGLRHFDRSGVSRVVEHSARKVQDQRKMSTSVQGLSDLLREADYWAGEQGREVVSSENVQKAIDSSVYRSDLLREKVQESIQRDVLLIETQGSAVGQVNGLSVVQLGEFMFGRPNRITARIRLGKGEVVDIEREAKLSGPIHSKGVLILSGFLGARYAFDRPLSLSASLVFEQSYGGIEGDSASSAELYALMSSISGVPIRQNLAVTGSVNQHGQVQAIGGVNEKIEGFFDICMERGLSGDQGVLIPQANVQHLMLRRDVIKAVEDGLFQVIPVRTIDQGIEILTGLTAGEMDENHLYPENTVNGMVQKQLNAFADKREQLNSGDQEGEKQ